MSDTACNILALICLTAFEQNVAFALPIFNKGSCLKLLIYAANDAVLRQFLIQSLPKIIAPQSDGEFTLSH